MSYGQALLAVDGLRCSFLTPRGEVKAVDGVSFEVLTGESLGVVGESGSGKTMTAMSMLRLFSPASRVRLAGRVLFHGEDLLRIPDRQLRTIRGGRIGVVFQDPLTSLDPVVPVVDQIGETMRLHRGLSRKASRTRAIELMERVGIPDAPTRARDLPHRFSGGMRQRIMIAIAISCEPELLIADEATTALDATVQAQILSLLADLRRDLGMAMIVISHDLGVIAAVCERVQVMYAGRIVERAPVADLLARPSHPYSAALVRLVPRMDQRVHHRLRPIPGQSPLVIGDTAGCPFAPRCEHRQERCTVEEPPERNLGPGQSAACWLAGDIAVADDEGEDDQGEDDELAEVGAR